jgi:hypothetical protein
MQLATSISEDGLLAFSSWTPSINLWSWPLRANETARSGERRQITFDSTIKLSLAVAANGSILAYAGYTHANQNEIRVRDNANGREEVIASSTAFRSQPRLSADGSRLAWLDLVEGKRVTYLSEPGAASPRQICENCVLLDFFSNPAKALIAYGNQLVRQDLDTGARTPLLDITGTFLSGAALSPGDRWVAFTVSRQLDGIRALYIAPATEQPAPRDAWIQIDEDRYHISRPSWSVDGKSIYYASNRDDNMCVWAQRITAEGQLDGAPTGILHLHESFQPWAYGGAPFGVTSDTLYILLPQIKGDAYMVNVDR